MGHWYDCGGHALLVASAVTDEAGHRRRHLVEQRADLGAVADILGRERGCDDLAGAGVQADVQFAPRPTRFRAVLLNQPLPL